MFPTKLKLVFCLTACLLVAACGRPEYEYADSKDVVIEEVNSRSMSGDFLEVSFTLRSKTKDERRTSYYRIHWFDKDGIMIDQTSWRPVSLRGRAPVPVRERSTKTGVKDFTIVLSNKAY